MSPVVVFALLGVGFIGLAVIGWWLFSRQKARTLERMKREHFGNLVAMAAADGNIDPKERELLLSSARNLGLSEEEAFSYVNSPQSQTFSVPGTEKLRLRQLVECINMMLVDGRIDVREKQFASQLAEKLGYRSERVVPVVMSAIAESNKRGDRLDLTDLSARVSGIAKADRERTRQMRSLAFRRKLREWRGCVGCLSIVVLIAAAIAVPIALKSIDIQRAENAMDRGEAFLSEKEYSMAAPCLAEAASTFRKHLYRDESASATSLLAVIELALGHQDLMEDRLREALEIYPRLTFSSFEHLCGRHDLKPPPGLESKFLHWRLTVAVRTYMQESDYLLRHANITSSIGADGLVSIGIRYNHKALYPNSQDASTHYRSTGNLEKDVTRDTGRMLREVVDFVRESGGLQLIDRIEIKCFHGVVQSSGFNPLGGREKATEIYTTETIFEGEDLKETTEVIKNLFPELRIQSTPF